MCIDLKCNILDHLWFRSLQRLKFQWKDNSKIYQAFKNQVQAEGDNLHIGDKYDTLRWADYNYERIITPLQLAGNLDLAWDTDSASLHIWQDSWNFSQKFDLYAFQQWCTSAIFPIWWSQENSQTQLTMRFIIGASRYLTRFESFKRLSDPKLGFDKL